MDVIEQRILESTTDDRFPPYVAAVLEVSGWFPGRALPAEALHALADEVAGIPQEEQALRLHATAREELGGFGALDLPSWRTPVIRTAPVAGHTWVAEDADLLQQIHDQAVTVVAVGHGWEVVMAEAGWCVVLTEEGRSWGGVTFEDMLIRAISGRGRGTRFTHDGLGRLLAEGRSGGGRARTDRSRVLVAAVQRAAVPRWCGREGDRWTWKKRATG